MLDRFFPLLSGLAVTAQIASGAWVITLLLSFAGGIAKLSPSASLRWLAAAYIEIFRGTSALVQLFWFYFVLPLLGIELSAMSVGILVLGLNGGAYGSEVVRGAIGAVPRGQYEAATALNFSRRQILWRVVVPQAVVNMLPPMGNILIEVLKATALVSLITISELTFTAQILRAETLRTTEIFSIVLMLYFLVALLLTGCVHILERRFSIGQVRGGIR